VNGLYKNILITGGIKMKKLIAIMLTTVLIFSGLVIPRNAEAAMPFKDIAPSHWSYGTFQWAHGAKIVGGYHDGTIRPSQNVSEAEFLAMLIRTFDSEASVSNPKHWADGIYKRADELNMPTFGPRGTALKRYQVAEIITGISGYYYIRDHAIHYILGAGLAQGNDVNNITIANYGGDKELTRAEAITFLWKLKNAGVTKLKVRPSTPSSISALPPLPSQPAQTGTSLEEKVQAVVGSSYNVIQSEDGKQIILDRADGEGVSIYGSDQSNVVNMYTAHIKEDREATVKMLRAIGYDTPDAFLKDLETVLSTAKRLDVKRGNHTYTIFPGRLQGRLIIVIE
jgi:hypothetical protein